MNIVDVKLFSFGLIVKWMLIVSNFTYIRRKYCEVRSLGCSRSIRGGLRSEQAVDS